MADPETRKQAARQGDAELAHLTLIEDIEANPDLPAGVSAEQAATAALCAISQRVSRGEARDLVLSLSPITQGLLQPCMRHREERSEVFDRNELIRRVAEHLDVGEQDAQRAARAVIEALRRHVPADELNDIEDQLPSDMKPLWQAKA